LGKLRRLADEIKHRRRLPVKPLCSQVQA
jgi:hypothetical protein